VRPRAISRTIRACSSRRSVRSSGKKNAREELRNELAAITEEIEEWQATYDARREELEQSLADGDPQSAELRERRDAIAFWRENEEDRLPSSSTHWNSTLTSKPPAKDDRRG